MKIIILLLASFSLIHGQSLNRNELDSLFNAFMDLKNPSFSDSRPAEDTEPDKCAFGIVMSVRQNFSYFSTEQQLILKKYLQRPNLQKTTVSPSGVFRVHYDTSGVKALKYDLNLLLQSLDSSYNYEVSILGYDPPPGDNQAGGDDKYDIYIENISYYGYTQPEDPLPGQTSRFYSYIVLDNDYSNTGTKGINGARVTVAHELHHAIQLGNYNYRENDLWFHEMSSTAMEEFVYDSINDYYFYMDDYFENTSVSFASRQGYELAVWNVFLYKKFNSDILVRQWVLYRNSRALDAIALSISEKGSNFQDMFSEFGIWLYFTNYRRIPGNYFEEAEAYPVARNLMEKTYTPPSDTLFLNSMPLAQSFITLFRENGTSLTDTFTVLISNSDYRRAITDPASLEPASYELYSDSAEGLTKLLEGYYQKFTAGNLSFWTTSEFLNGQLVKQGYVRIEGELAFPSPFIYSRHSLIYIPVRQNPAGEAELNVFSPSMDLVYKSSKEISRMFSKDIITWDGRDSYNSRLGTGVYIYVIKSGDEITKGKIVLFND